MMDSPDLQPQDSDSSVPVHRPRVAWIRLAALALLLLATAPFFDWRGLVADMSRATDPWDAEAVEIEAKGLDGVLVVGGHGVERIDGANFIRVRVASPDDPAEPPTLPPGRRVRATFQDDIGAEIGWRVLEPVDSGAHGADGRALRIPIPSGAEPARIVLDFAP